MTLKGGAGRHQRADPASNGWHFDRRIPVATLLVLLLQTGAVVWWAAGESAQTDENTRRIGTIERRMEGEAILIERITRVEGEVRLNREVLERIERRLNQHGGKRGEL